MPPLGFKPTISAGEQPYTDALDRAATGTGSFINTAVKIEQKWKKNIYTRMNLWWKERFIYVLRFVFND
jgi:hypothetical protein